MARMTASDDATQTPQAASLDADAMGIAAAMQAPSPGGSHDYGAINFRDFEATSAQSVLPDPKPIPGWHLTYQSTLDMATLNRLQMHPYLYEIVKPEDYDFLYPEGTPEREKWWSGQPKNPSLPNVISCNELILLKVPESHYLTIMLYNHHKKPLDMEIHIQRGREMAHERYGDVRFLREGEDKDVGGSVVNYGRVRGATITPQLAAKMFPN